MPQEHTPAPSAPPQDYNPASFAPQENASQFATVPFKPAKDCMQVLSRYSQSDGFAFVAICGTHTSCLFRHCFSMHALYQAAADSRHLERLLSCCFTHCQAHSGCGGARQTHSGCGGARQTHSGCGGARQTQGMRHTGALHQYHQQQNQTQNQTQHHRRTGGTTMMAALAAAFVGCLCCEALM
jgi:hypothetical protein